MIRRHPFVQSVEAGLRRRCGVGPSARLLVAVSGGADSVALLVALKAVARQSHYRLDLHVGHVHHHLRAGADADAEAVADLAGRLDLPFHRRDVTIASAAGNLEAAARRERYAALAGLADELAAEAVATAHHADDQLETILMRLARGASVRGLAAMADRTPLSGATVVRPMLETDHAAAVAFCGEAGVSWREDPTNADRDRWRARLRAEVLPVLRELRPDAARKAVESARRLRDATRIVARWTEGVAERLIVEEAGERWMERGAARELGREELAALLRRQAVELGVRADRLAGRVIDRIAHAAASRSGEARRFDLADGAAVEVSARYVTFKPPRTGRGQSTEAAP